MTSRELRYGGRFVLPQTTPAHLGGALKVERSLSALSDLEPEELTMLEGILRRRVVSGDADGEVNSDAGE